ncbi:11222_t:CDS:2 [Paraglomus occultum]|uniref:11222_t:CDS:1 n=1 Tax=Paraglomus occultum TaxID=144539 RepID=A0A9N9GIQ7_9GLOM|nr:11222_t:CDS:2 [Paraglomus occultum]
MPAQVVASLAIDLSHLLSDTSLADIKIEVGSGTDKKVFYAHAAVLYTRCPYFRTKALEHGSKYANAGSRMGETFIRIDDIRPNIFEHILNYIYTDSTPSTDLSPDDLLTLLAACTRFSLILLIASIQTILVDHHSSYLLSHFSQIDVLSTTNKNFSILRRYCQNTVKRHPTTIMKSEGFVYLSEDMLIKILKSDKLTMDETEIWEYVLRWATAQEPVLLMVSSWSAKEYELLKDTLKNIIPHLRFFQMPSNQFLIRSQLFQYVLPYDLFIDVYNYHTQNSYTPLSPILPQRQQSKKRNVTWHHSIDGEYDDSTNKEVTPPLPSSPPTATSPLESPSKKNHLDSLLMTPTHANYLASCIFQHTQTNNSTTNKPTPNTLYRFRLLYRASIHSFSVSAFHRLCDRRGPTVTIARIRDSSDIVGGYTDVSWQSSKKGSFKESNDSFIFSFDKGDAKKAQVRWVKKSERQRAVWVGRNRGVVFGDGYDLAMGIDENDEEWVEVGDGDIVANASEEEREMEIGDGHKHEGKSLSRMWNKSKKESDKELGRMWMCSPSAYDGTIRSEAGVFAVDEIEVFQVVKKKMKSSSRLYR